MRNLYKDCVFCKGQGLCLRRLQLKISIDADFCPHFFPEPIENENGSRIMPKNTKIHGRGA
jgi:hypothetical protein